MTIEHLIEKVDIIAPDGTNCGRLLGLWIDCRKQKAATATELEMLREAMPPGYNLRTPG